VTDLWATEAPVPEDGAMSQRKLWIVIDVGCHECGVDSVPVGAFATQAEAQAAANRRASETEGWRDGGQTIAQVFSVDAP
jgi:hypothetical protein